MLDECLDVVEFFDLAQVASVPWKNGGGSTRELACWPPGAGMDGFEWRVSVATIAVPGPFSAFPGVDRQIMLLQGDGVQLRSPQAPHGGWTHALDQRWVPFSFAGDVPVDCTLLGGTSTDFNLMLRRGAWTGAMHVVHSVQSVPTQHGAGLCLVLAGAWRWGSGSGARTLAPGQGAWWMLESDAADDDAKLCRLVGDRAVPKPLPVAPLPKPGDGVPPTLAWIALRHSEAPGIE